MKKTRKRQLSLILAAALMVSVSGPGAEAKSKLALNRKKVTLQQGKSFRLKVKGTKKKVKWASSRKKVAVVNKKGKITAKKAGTAKITARVGKKRLVCRVTVKRKASEANPSQGGTTQPGNTQGPVPTPMPSAGQTGVPVQTAPANQTEVPRQTDPVKTPPVQTESAQPSPGRHTSPPTETPSQTPVPDEVPVEFFQTTQPDYETGTPEVPLLSADSGVYGNAFKLGMKSQPGTQIYYTTDGSIPTTESNKYTDAFVVVNRNGMPNVLSTAQNIKKMYINGSGYDYTPKADEVAKCTVIRAVAVSPDNQASEVVTRSYFVGNEVKTKYKGATVMSLVIDPDSLLNYETGIHVLGKLYDEWRNTEEGSQLWHQYWNYVGNYTQSGREWERQAVVDYFDADSEKLEFSAPLGVRLHGGASRMYGQKSFKFYFREEYGQKNLKYPLIPGDLDAGGEQIKKYKSFMLRNGGNDTEYSKIRDVFNQSMVEDRAFGVQAARPCVLFINGEYWGLYNLTEKYSDNSLETQYGVDKDNVVVYKEGEMDEGQDGDEALYEELWSYADKDFSDDAVYEQFCNIVDIDSFVDYYATEIYIANSDWDPEKNYLIWRARIPDGTNPYADGKWRYLLYDTEYSMSLYNDRENQADYDSFSRALRQDSLFSAVTKNKKFQEKFIAAVQEIGSVNFDPDACNRKLNEYVSVYKPLMQDYYTRFFGRDSWQRNQFDSATATIKDFITKRYTSIISHVQKGCALR